VDLSLEEVSWREAGVLFVAIPVTIDEVSCRGIKVPIRGIFYKECLCRFPASLLSFSRNLCWGFGLIQSLWPCWLRCWIAGFTLVVVKLLFCFVWDRWLSLFIPISFPILLLNTVWGFELSLSTSQAAVGNHSNWGLCFINNRFDNLWSALGLQGLALPSAMQHMLGNLEFLTCLPLLSTDDMS